MENQWTELTCRVAVGDLDEMAAIAQMVVGAGLYIEDYSDLEEKTLEIAHIDLIDEELVAKDRAHALIHLYLPPEMSPAEPISYIGRRCEECGIPVEISTRGSPGRGLVNRVEAVLPSDRAFRPTGHLPFLGGVSSPGGTEDHPP